MTSKSRPSCGECTRRKIKCNRELPCLNCFRFNSYCYYVKKELKLNKSITDWDTHADLNMNDSRDHLDGKVMSRYMLNKCLKLEKRLEGLNSMLGRLVNQSMIDPKIESIMEGFDFKLYESTVGGPICIKVLKSKPKLKLHHPEVDAKVNDLFSDLVQMAFDFASMCHVSFTTIQECYAKSGINSFLVNCIASSMFPHYTMLRGRLERLELADNVFYLRALHLLNSPNTSQMEVIWGIPFMLQLELQSGNIISAFVHIGKLTLTSYELRLHCFDEQYSMSPRRDNDLKSCEMRNAWWACLNCEAAASLCFLRPINLTTDPMQTQIPHPDLDFNPSPFDYKKPIEDSFSEVITSLYQKESHFNSLAKFTWLTACISRGFNRYLKFCADLKGYYNSFQTLKNEHRILFEKNEYHFNLDQYLENIQSNPVYYATTSHLSSHLVFHGYFIIQYLVQYRIDVDFNQLDHAKNSLAQVKVRAMKLLNFIRSTIVLPNYPPPPTDLTDYYLSGATIPIMLLQIMKAFVPVQSQRDLECLKLIAAVIRKYSIVSSACELYSEWCENIIKNNGQFNIKSATKGDILIIGLLRENWYDI